MLGILAKYIQDVSVLRRLLFAATFVNPDLPMFWGVVLEFATAGEISKSSITPDQVKVLIENLQALNSKAFETDINLQKELIYFDVKKPLGIPLISLSNSCLMCGSPLQLRRDRPAPIVVYDFRCGTIPGAHYHKFCPKRTCSFIQYYGYYSIQGRVFFSPDWKSLPYFFSSHDTAFSMEILNQYEANLLIGHLSFQQQADIYNYLHNYTKCARDKVNEYVTATVYAVTIVIIYNIYAERLRSTPKNGS